MPKQHIVQLQGRLSSHPNQKSSPRFLLGPVQEGLLNQCGRPTAPLAQFKLKLADCIQSTVTTAKPHAV
jgi:hypothetical protein